ncbi:aldo/keto reductase [Streptomyces sp. NPDC048751]|uniref:aldo/keto reductase n=1 Tax=Streptomyces sp. NPDC048751 TaxID=3365591 RepID=UPI0037165098
MTSTEPIDVASVQNRYNLLDREHEPVLAACEAAGIAFLPWRPVEENLAAARLQLTPAQRERRDLLHGCPTT